mmetsp:Transcript_49563/g.97163  ORF Transcript_49563/g.97163 Transcript_49563/m.97163 type:complete len:215 (-) Transcript_49563:1380-2024(-)
MVHISGFSDDIFLRISSTSTSSAAGSSAGKKALTSNPMGPFWSGDGIRELALAPSAFTTRGAGCFCSFCSFWPGTRAGTALKDGGSSTLRLLWTGLRVRPPPGPNFLASCSRSALAAAACRSARSRSSFSSCACSARSALSIASIWRCSLSFFSWASLASLSLFSLAARAANLSSLAAFIGVVDTTVTDESLSVSLPLATSRWYFCFCFSMAAR